MAPGSAPAVGDYRYPPLDHLFGPRRPGLTSHRRTRLTAARFASRARRDQQLRLAVAVGISVLAMELVSGEPTRLLTVLLPFAFMAVQLGFTALRTSPSWVADARLSLTLAFVLLAEVLTDQSGTWSLGVLLVPVVAVAAYRGGRTILIAGIGVAAALIPLAVPSVASDVRREAVAIAIVAFVVANGSRHVVRTLEESAKRVRHANSRDRRRARELGAVETVGRVLARVGPTSDGLDSIMALLEETFQYRYPSVYIWDGSMLRLGAQRNYRFPIESIPPDVGVVGRVVRTREPVFLPDVRIDPDFRSADPAVVSEISLPLLSDGELFGVLNVETDSARPLDASDYATMLIVSDRLAAWLALGRERQKLTERTALLDRFSSFGTVLNSTLDQGTVHEFVVAGAAVVIPADMLALVQLHEPTGEYRVAAITGGGEAMLGARILPGEGITGRAIATGTVVIDDRLERASYPRMTARAKIADAYAAMAAPMVIEGQVTGVVAWFREDTSRTFSQQEREIAQLVGGRVALALANAALHHAAQEAAITDALTGLHNRRHFDAAVTQADALRARQAVDHRRPRAAILFDLDHFGAVNKRHGHQVGDRILQAFAAVLRSRARASDIVARYGGEEFVVILEGATLEDAVRLADEIRLAFRQGSIDAADAGTTITTVSAGCSALQRSETSGATLLERADVGLAMAKAAGRDQVVAA